MGVLRSAAGLSLRAAKSAVGMMPLEMQRGLEQRTALVLNEGLAMLDSKLKVQDPTEVNGHATASGLGVTDLSGSHDCDALTRRLEVS